MARRTGTSTERIQGQADVDINARGRAQADRNGDLMKSLIGDGAGFDFVASPLRRTRDTMERIRTRMGLDPKNYHTDPRLMEVSFGDWQGFMIEDIAAKTPELVEERGRDKWNFVRTGAHGRELCDIGCSCCELVSRGKGTHSLRNPWRLPENDIPHGRETGRPRCRQSSYHPGSASAPGGWSPYLAVAIPWFSSMSVMKRSLLTTSNINVTFIPCSITLRSNSPGNL